MRAWVDPTAFAAPASIQSPPRATENDIPSMVFTARATFDMPDPNEMPTPLKPSLAVSLNTTAIASFDGTALYPHSVTMRPNTPRW